MDTDTLQNPRWALRLAANWPVLHALNHPSFAELIASVHAAERGKLDGVALGRSGERATILFVHRGHVCGLVYAAGMPARVIVGEDALPLIARMSAQMTWTIASVPAGERGLIPVLAGLTAGGGSYRIRETGTNRSAHMQTLRDIKNSATMFVVARPQGGVGVTWLIFADSDGATKRISVSDEQEVSTDEPDSSRMLSQLRRPMRLSELRHAVLRYISYSTLLTHASDNDRGDGPAKKTGSWGSWLTPFLALGAIGLLIAIGVRLDSPGEPAASVPPEIDAPATGEPPPLSQTEARAAPVAYAESSVDKAPELIASTNQSTLAPSTDTTGSLTVMSLLVTASGSVAHSVFVEGPAEPRASIREAVEAWRFAPAQLDDQAVSCWITVRVGPRPELLP